MKQVNFRRVFVLAGLTTLVIVYVLLWLRMISSPSERTGSDFISAYTGGRVADIWGAANVYNLEYQQVVQQGVVGFALAPDQVLMFEHPPYLVPLLSLFMDGNYLASLDRYAILMVVIYAAGMAVAYRLIRLDGWERAPALLMLAGMVTFYPLFVSLLNTQDTALMVLGGFLWLLGLWQKKDVLAGLGLALTTVRPHIALLLALPFLFRRRGVFWGFCLATVGLAGISWLAVGISGLEAYARLLLTAAGGEGFGTHESAMINLIGLLWRIDPNLGGDTIHWIGWAVYGVTLVGLCVMWARSREIAEKQIGLAVTLVVFVAPHLHYHDLTLLLVALAAALLALVRGGFLRAQKAALIPLVLSMALLFSNFAAVLEYAFPYLVMLLLVVVLYIPGVVFRGKPGSHESEMS
jgi:hypothetical protein